MASGKLTTRERKLMKMVAVKQQRRKHNAPARGVEKSLQEENRVVLDRVLAKISTKK